MSVVKKKKKQHICASLSQFDQVTQSLLFEDRWEQDAETTMGT